MGAADPKSKKPSGASSGPNRKPPENPVLFLDEGLGQHVIADALRSAGAQVEIHAQHFASGSADEEWLPRVGLLGWLVLTKDFRIRYRGLALRAIRIGSARVFVLKKTENLTGAEIGGIFAKALPGIYRTALRKPPPFIAKVGRDGDVKVWWPEQPSKSRRHRP